MSGFHFFLPLPIAVNRMRDRFIKRWWWCWWARLVVIVLSMMNSYNSIWPYHALSLSLSPRHTVLLYWVTKVHKSFHLFSRFHVWGDLTLEIQLIYSGFFPRLSLSLTHSLHDPVFSSFLFSSSFLSFLFEKKAARVPKVHNNFLSLQFSSFSFFTTSSPS